MKLVYVLSMMLCFSGCKSCFSKIAAHDPRPYLNIMADSSKLTDSCITFYIDSFLNKNDTTPASFKSMFYISSAQNGIDEQERLVHFKTLPDEWYLVAFDATPCWVAMVYNPLYGNDPVDDKAKLPDGEVKRIAKRLQAELIDKAELYAHEHNRPDSFIYAPHNLR